MPYPAYKVSQIQYIAKKHVGLISVAHQAMWRTHLLMDHYH